MFSENVCKHCGACCAFFRVSFYWREADPSQGGKVPSEYVEEETEFHDNLKGTNQAHPYCAALSGKIGERVSCTIYNHRPSPCREFGIHYIHGKNYITPEDLERCNKARAAWNLPPLTMDELNPGAPRPEFTKIIEKVTKHHRIKFVSRKQRGGSGSMQPPSYGEGSGLTHP